MSKKTTPPAEPVTDTSAEQTAAAVPGADPATDPAAELVPGTDPAAAEQLPAYMFGALSIAEEICRLYDFEGHKAVLERLSAIDGVDAPAFGQVDGWHTMTFCGIEARSAVSGKPLLDNWAAMARRTLRAAA